jgi:hypothetical protein
MSSDALSIKANLRKLASGIEFEAKPIDRIVDPSLLPHYLTFQAAKAVIATHSLFAAYAYRCAQELATARIINTQPSTWRNRLAAYRAANVSAARARIFGRVKPEAAPVMRIGVIGCGVVGRTVVESLLDAGLTLPGDVVISTRTINRANAFAVQGVSVVFDNATVAAEASVLFVCVPPAQLQTIASELREALRPCTLVVVLAAALKTSKMRALFPGSHVIHASSVDVARLRDELGVVAAIAATERERKVQRPGDELGMPAGPEGALDATPSEAAAPSAPAKPALVMHPSSFLRGPEHIVALSAAHLSERWAAGLAAGVEAALHGLELDEDEARLLCLKAVLGVHMRGEHVLQSIEVLEAARASAPRADAADAPRRADAQQPSPAACAFAEEARAHLSAVVTQLHSERVGAGAP